MTTNQHYPIELANGTTVCSCGHGNKAGYLPFYGAGDADMYRQTQSRGVFSDHLAAVLSYEASLVRRQKRLKSNQPLTTETFDALPTFDRWDSRNR